MHKVRREGVDCKRGHESSRVEWAKSEVGEDRGWLAHSTGRVGRCERGGRYTKEGWEKRV